jgi:arginyl-tRNA synthetase
MNDVISAVVKQLYDYDVEVVLTRPDAQFGDWTTNVALQLAKPLGKNPREIAERIAGLLRSNEDFSDVTVAGPGFINITLTERVIVSLIKREPVPHMNGQTVVLEYSCPNAFKELHTGHLYQTIFGDILSRLFLVNGAKLHRTSFGGDVGLHVAKCLWGICEKLGGELPEKLSNTVSENPFERSLWISQCYVQGADAYENDEIAKNTIDELNKTIYSFHDTKDYESALAKIYWETRQWSFDYFDAFYDLIKVEHMKYYPESQTAPLGLAVVREQLQAGNLKESKGAVVFEGDESKHLHTRVFVTSKGLPTYETKDIGVIWMEKEEYDFDHRYLITGNDQREYMRVVFAAAETFRPELAGAMTHMTNGTVKFADGKKMSSRLGNVTRALDVIEIIREKVSQIVEDKALIDDVTLGAIKYAFARYKLGGDISFDIEETVSLQGNSGPYLQYAHARARRILEKSENDVTQLVEIFEEDRSLARKLSEYSETVELAARLLEPHHICNYLFELAQEFNRYYEKNKVLGSDKEVHRLSLVATYADTLKAGLIILGIYAPNKM